MPKTGPSLIINTYNTIYDVISEVAEKLDYVERKVDPCLCSNPYQYESHHQRIQSHNEEQGLSKTDGAKKKGENPAEEFDICWFDLAITPDVLYKIRPYQRISQWPGIQVIAHKNKLGQNLMIMRRQFPEDYDYFPQTYILPYEMNQFKSEFHKKKEEVEAPPEQLAIDLMKPKKKKKEAKRKPYFEKKEKLLKKIFIIKPESESQGKGIFLTKTWEDIDPHDHLVAQKYIDPPYLIDGLKFDLRIYVLLYGINPLRIYLYEEGLARFATKPYEAPKGKNLKDIYMHLTNYAINKNSNNYVQNDDENGAGDGHKRSLS